MNSAVDHYMNKGEPRCSNCYYCRGRQHSYSCCSVAAAEMDGLIYNCTRFLLL
jgi:hypothetical protein